MIHSEITMEEIIAGKKNGNVIQGENVINGIGMKQMDPTIKRNANGMMVVQPLPEVPMEEPTFCCCGCDMLTMSILFTINYVMMFVAQMLCLLRVFVNDPSEDGQIDFNDEDASDTIRTYDFTYLLSSFGKSVIASLVLIILHLMMVVSPKPTVSRILAVIYAIQQWSCYIVAGLLYIILIVSSSTGRIYMENGNQGIIIVMVMGAFPWAIIALIGYLFQHTSEKHYGYDEYLKEQANIKKQEEESNL